jgi:hypothetical protein
MIKGYKFKTKEEVEEAVDKVNDYWGLSVGDPRDGTTTYVNIYVSMANKEKGEEFFFFIFENVFTTPILGLGVEFKVNFPSWSDIYR